MQPNLHGVQEIQIRSYLAAGRKIEAIKHYREAMGAGLAEAKAAIEAMEARPPTGSARKTDRPSRKPGRAAGFVVALLIAALCAGALLWWRGQDGGPKNTSTDSNAPAVIHRAEGPKEEGLLGEWVLKNPKREFKASFHKVGDDEYRLLPNGLVYSGVYKLDGTQLTMPRSMISERSGNP